MISSLGARRDAAAVVPLGGLLRDDDPAVARAAALALGAIGTAEAATVLQAALQSADRRQAGRDRRPVELCRIAVGDQANRPTPWQFTSRCPAKQHGTTGALGGHARHVGLCRPGRMTIPT